MKRGRLRQACIAARNYICYDLREIVAPSSLPDPPGLKHKRLTLAQYWQAAKRATREYKKTWRWEEKAKPGEPGSAEPGKRPGADEPLSEDLTAAARGGVEALKPLLAQLYQTRAAAYRDS
ncbi:hypothetical protein WJX81_007689 [Elliptochloris bilobata]|uniref:Uncharacterized protein n=1 Tax=Elliptochloris bilobata TaxID=381761 RepID=A0AAW1QDS7_9CHLO